MSVAVGSVAGTTGKKIGFDFWTFHVCHFCPHYVHLLIFHTCNKNAAYLCRYFTMCKKEKLPLVAKKQKTI